MRSPLIGATVLEIISEAVIAVETTETVLAVGIKEAVLAVEVVFVKVLAITAEVLITEAAAEEEVVVASIEEEEEVVVASIEEEEEVVVVASIEEEVVVASIEEEVEIEGEAISILGEAVVLVEVALTNPSDPTAINPLTRRLSLTINLQVFCQPFEEFVFLRIIFFKSCSLIFQRGSFGNYGDKAAKTLFNTKGKSFKHEKTKKKRGTYKGGIITTQVKSIKF